MSTLRKAITAYCGGFEDATDDQLRTKLESLPPDIRAEVDSLMETDDDYDGPTGADHADERIGVDPDQAADTLGDASI